MVSRSCVAIAAAGLLAAGCNATANQPPARIPETASAPAPSLSRVDALVADAAVAATAGDPLSARQFLAEALALEPGDAAVRAQLALLGGAPTPQEVTQPPAAPALVAALRTPVRRAPTLASLGEVAPPAAAGGAAVAGADAQADSAQSDAPAHEAPRPRPPTRLVAARRRVAVLAAREDSLSRADSILTARGDAAPPRGKHKRTWPWTRAQRWLVAKGVVGGSGAGVVVGALIGNVPGALLAGSLGGGAVGFKKATTIGPAAPFPTKADSVAFREEKRRDDAEKAREAAQTKAGAPTAELANQR